MSKKRYDPLWEVVGEKVLLQGRAAHVDAACPHCYANLQLSPEVAPGSRVACGLCGQVSEVTEGPDGFALSPPAS